MFKMVPNALVSLHSSSSASLPAPRAPAWTMSTPKAPTWTMPVPTLPSLALITLAIGCGGGQAPQPETASEQAAQEAAQSAPQGTLPSAANGPPQTALIDDLEDGNHQLHVADGRGGWWYTYADETSSIEPAGAFVPAEGGANGSGYAARMQGQIGSKQYPFAGMGFNFIDPKMVYDLSSCEGLSFFAKKGSAQAISAVRFKVGDVNTVPEGGVCKDCYNDLDVSLTEEWTQYSVKFSELRQEPYWGEPRPAIDAARVFQLQWQVKDPSGPFDVWVDDVRLLGCGS